MQNENENTIESIQNKAAAAPQVRLDLVHLIYNLTLKYLLKKVNVKLRDNRVLSSQSYNSPLGLYSKENVANTLVATMQR